jgi:hypothetical protein
MKKTKKRRNKRSTISGTNRIRKTEMASITINQRKTRIIQESDPITTTRPTNKIKETQHLLGWKKTTDNSRISAASRCLP